MIQTRGQHNCWPRFLGSTLCSHSRQARAEASEDPKKLTQPSTPTSSQTAGDLLGHYDTTIHPQTHKKLYIYTDYTREKMTRYKTKRKRKRKTKKEKKKKEREKEKKRKHTHTYPHVQPRNRRQTSQTADTFFTNDIRTTKNNYFFTSSPLVKLTILSAVDGDKPKQFTARCLERSD